MQTIKSNLLKKMQHFCAYQDRCHFEAEQKLQKLNADKETAGEIMIQLIDEGFLNEERYARSVARGKFRIHHWGKIKIIAHLKARFVSDPLITVALSEIEPEEYHEELQKQMEKIYKEKKDQHKTIQALIAKGFETELVFEVASGLN
jgi:regulatory protein